ncbi:porin [Thiohalomonas denitrificans]|uniref:porin n=1 Tax=Thiohalomonas denitrificans TaxID=415747 RepID=UPI0026EC7401|nr:porin [Thiohalomonas denitrificans]
MKNNNRSARDMNWLRITALAGACALATPAQALQLNIYGVGHVSADSVDNGTDSESFIASNSSRLGFRGNHELGNGLAAVFQYEAGVDLTGQGGNDGNGAAAGSTSDIFTAARDSYAGLSGGFGSVVAGKVGGLNQWLYDYNLFGDQVGDLGNVWGGSGLPGRVTDALQYQTPNVGGLSLGLTYVPDEDADVSEDVIIAKADYATGGLNLGGAYTQLGQDDPVNDDDWTVVAVTASYGFDRFTVGGGLQSETDIGGVSGADRSSYTVGASAKVGANGLWKAQYATSDHDNDDQDASQIAIGYDHAVNDYTTVYAAYAAVDNDDAAAITANNYGHGDAVTPALGKDPSAFSLGIVIKFDAGLI